MQAFTHYSPTVFMQKPVTLPVPCGQRTCEAIVPFDQMVVWGWLQQGEQNFRAFCCWGCSLKALPETQLNQG